MHKKSMRLLSMCLALIMGLSLAPLYAFAESSELPDGQIIALPEGQNPEGEDNEESLSLPDDQAIAQPEPQSPEGEDSEESLNLPNDQTITQPETQNPEPLSLPEGQTIILPVVKGREGEKKDFPNEETKGNEPARGLRTFSANEDKVYAPTGVNSYYINGRIYLDTETEPVSGAMLQVLAKDGETVLANTPGIDHYQEDEDTGRYYINYEYITLLREITPGTYSMQLVAEQEKISALTDIVFSDQPFLASVDLNNFSVGADNYEIYVRMYNSSETQLEQLTFSLLDSNDAVAGQTTGLYRDLDLSSHDGRQISGYTQMNISGSVQSEEDYRLAITYNGSGTLCDGTGGMAGYSPNSPSDTYPEITGFDVIDPQTSKVSVSVDYLQPGGLYILTIRDGYFGNVLHQSTVSGTKDPIAVNLCFNGLTVPVTTFDAYEFYVEIQRVNGYEIDSGYFDNPYYNSAAEDYYFDFTPYYINSGTTSLPFTLVIYNPGSLYDGETDFTVSVKGSNETELASVSGNQTTIVRDGGEYKISGTLSFSSLPAGSVDIYFNTLKIGDANVTDTLCSSDGLGTQDWDHKTFWLMMEQLYLNAEVINSSGTAKLVLKDSSGNNISDSGIVAGTGSELHNHLNYVFSLTPELIDGEKYSLVLVDGVNEYELFTDYTYDGEFKFNPQNDFYLQNAPAGNTSISGRVYCYSDASRNMTAAHLNSFLQSLELQDSSGNVYGITGYANGRFEYGGSYYFDITLNSPLSAGDYTLTSPDGYIRNLTISGTSGYTPPELYGNDAGDGYAEGCYLPADSTYTAKIYRGYSCVTNEPFILTLSGEYTGGNTQYLYIPRDVMSGLNSGTYEMRVYKDGVLLDGVPLTVSDTQQVIVSAYDPQSQNNTLISSSGYVSFKVSGGKYTALRFSENSGQLSNKIYDSILNNAFSLSDGGGEKTLYVQLKDASGNESEVIVLKIYRYTGSSLVNIYVHESVQGLYDESTVTLNLGAETQYFSAYVDFVDAGGNVQTAGLNYKEFGSVTGFLPGDVGDQKHIFSNTFNTLGNNGDLGNIDETILVRFYLTDKSNNVVSEVIERTLFFGSLTDIIMPQFKPQRPSYQYAYITKDENVTLKGYATPNSNVNLAADDGNGGGFDADVPINEYGFFSYTEEGIAEGEYTITATDLNELTVRQMLKLIVDRKPPDIAELSFTFIDDKNVSVEWYCNDVDISNFKLYKNNLLQATITNTSTTEYSYNLLASIGDKFTLTAADMAGNAITLTRELTDLIPPSTPGTPAMTSHGTKKISFEWAASTDNVTVFEYDIYRDGELIKSVGYENTACTDTGLSEGKDYVYKVYARDKTGNKSEGSTATLSTAVLAIATNTDFSPEYIKEQHPNGIGVSVTLDVSDIYYNASRSDVKLQYKLGTAQDWSEITLDGAGAEKSGIWNIEGLTDGTYQVRFLVIDTEGTETTGAVSDVIISHDNVPPAVNISTPSNTAPIIGKNLLISGNSGDNIAVDRILLSYSSDGGTVYSNITTLVNEKATGRNTFNWQYIFDASTLPSVSTIFKATAVDARGNTSYATVEVTLDNTPVAQEISIYLDGIKISQDMLLVPAQGAGSLTRTYTAKLLDQYGDMMDSEITWSVTSNDSGATASGGTVTVSAGAAKGAMILTATDTVTGKSAAVTITVTDLTLDWSVIAQKVGGITYGDTKASAFSTLPATGTAAAGSVTFAGTFAIVGADEILTAGNQIFTVKFTVTAEGGYKGAEFTKDYTVMVKPKAVTVTVDEARKEYGSENPAFTAATPAGALVGSDTISSLNLSLVSSSNKASAPGNYDVTGTADNPNYIVTVSGTNKLTVTKAALTLTGTPVFAAILANNPANNSQGSLTSAVQTANPTLAASYINGTSTLTAAWTLKTDTYKPTGGTYTFEAALTPTDSTNFSYSGPNQGLTVTVTPVIGTFTYAPASLSKVKSAINSAGTMADLGLPSQISVTCDNGVLGGTYDITGWNYTLAKLQAIDVTSADAVLDLIPTVAFPAWATIDTDALKTTLTITNKLPVDVTVVPPAGVTYGTELGNPVPNQADAGNGVESSPAWTYMYTGTTRSGTAHSSADKPVQAGEYTVTATLVSETYSGSAASEAFTISPKVLTDDMLNISGTYSFTGSAITPSYTVSDGALISTSDYSVEASNNINAGTTSIAVRAASTGNYSGTLTKYFTIEKATAPAVNDIERKHPMGKVSEGSVDVSALLPINRGAATYTIIGGRTGDAITGSIINESGLLSYTTTSSAAEKTTTITVKAESQNYTDVTVKITVRLVAKTDNTDGGKDHTSPVKPTPAPTPAEWKNPFVDVQKGDWFYGDVEYAFTNSLMVGTSTDPMLFSPNMHLSRAMSVTVLYRIAGSPDASGFVNPYDDVDENSWYTDAVKWAAAKGIASGYGNGKFGPKENIMREQMAVILINFENLSGKMPHDIQVDREYVDQNEISDWAKNPVNKLTIQGIISGKPGNLFDPKGETTRAEFAAMLHRFLEATK